MYRRRPELRAEDKWHALMTGAAWKTENILH